MHEHSEKLEGLVNDALDKGAEIVARGSFGHIVEDTVDQYFPPTVIVNVNHSMRLMQEEVLNLVIFSAFQITIFFLSFFITFGFILFIDNPYCPCLQQKKYRSYLYYKY